MNPTNTVLKARRNIIVHMETSNPNCIRVTKLDKTDGAPFGPYKEGCTIDRECYELQVTTMQDADLEANICMDTQDGCVFRFAKYCAGNTGFLIKSDGSLWACGDNLDGALGFGNSDNTFKQPQYRQAGLRKDWVYIQTANGISIGLRANGTLWGSGKFGTPSVSEFDGQQGSTSFAQIGDDTDWMYLGGVSVLIKQDGSLWQINGADSILAITIFDLYEKYQECFHDNWYQDCFNDFVKIVNGNQCTYGIREDGSLWVWGLSWIYGNFGIPGIFQENLRAMIPSGKWRSPLTDLLPPLVDIAAGADCAYAIGADGRAWLTGFDLFLPRGSNQKSYMEAGWSLINNDTDWKNVWAGEYSPIVVLQKTNGDVYIAGNNYYGELGLGDTADHPGINFLGNYPNLVHSSGSGRVAFLLFSDGTMLVSGEGINSGLGDSGAQHTTFTQVPGSWKHIECAGVTSLNASSIAVSMGGSIWSCGNNNGHLGDGTLVDRDTFLNVGGSNIVKAILLYENYGYALQSDGKVVGWGVDANGIGLSSNTYKYPTLLTLTMNTATQLIGHSFEIGHTALMVLSNDKMIYGASSGIDGINWTMNQLISNWTVDEDYSDFAPIRSPKPRTVSPVTLSESLVFKLMIKEDGTLWVHGGDTFSSAYSSMYHTGDSIFWRQIGTDTDWKKVECGNYHVLALKNDNTLWVCGRNQFGECGQGHFDPIPELELSIFGKGEDSANKVVLDISASSFISAIHTNSQRVYHCGNSSACDYGVGDVTYNANWRQYEDIIPAYAEWAWRGWPIASMVTYDSSTMYLMATPNEGDKSLLVASGRSGIIGVPVTMYPRDGCGFPDVPGVCYTDDDIGPVNQYVEDALELLEGITVGTLINARMQYREDVGGTSRWPTNGFSVWYKFWPYSAPGGGGLYRFSIENLDDPLDFQLQLEVYDNNIETEADLGILQNNPILITSSSADVHISDDVSSHTIRIDTFDFLPHNFKITVEYLGGSGGP